jgi:hypothetical protein
MLLVLLTLVAQTGPVTPTVPPASSPATTPAAPAAVAVPTANATASAWNWWEKAITFVIGAVGGWISGTLKVRGQRRVAIDGLVQKIIELSMEYPYLERNSYCAAWTKDAADDDDRARYENYCCLVFNTLENAWELCWPWFWSKEKRHKKIRNIFHVDELICRHHRWWDGDNDNIDGYADGFREYVRFVIDKCRRENRI